jgi:hypothetical protein
MKPWLFFSSGILLLCLACRKDNVQHRQESLTAFTKKTRVEAYTSITGQTIPTYDLDALYLEYRPSTVSSKPRSFYLEWEVPYKQIDGKPFTVKMRDVITVPANTPSLVIYPDAIFDFNGVQPVISAYRIIPLSKVSHSLLEVLEEHEFNPNLAADPATVKLNRWND